MFFPAFSRFRACRALAAILLVPLVVKAADNALPAEQAALLDTYCVKCHNSEDWAGSLDFAALNRQDIVADAVLWEKVIRKFRGSMMPPKGNDRPDEHTSAVFIGWLQTTLDNAQLAHPNPGKSSLHRLNRTEYGNAVRDLLGLHVDISEFLPADDEGYGFDNIADVLRTSPSLLEQYLDASRKISELAIGDLRTLPISKTYRPNPDLPHFQHIPGLPLGTRGGVLIEHNFPLDAEYDISTFLVRNIVGYMTGLEWPHQFIVNIDGEEVFRTQVGGEADNLRSDTNFAEAADAIDARLKTRVAIAAGRHTVAITFLDKNGAETHEPLELFTRNLDLQDMVGMPMLDYVDIAGPFNASGRGDTASRRTIFSCYPTVQSEQPECAEQILSRLGSKAFRRPLSATDRNMILSFYADGVAKGSFDEGIQTALRYILTSPEFLFRSEADPASVNAGEVYALDDLALASRLAFFLWSSIPDEELLTLAAKSQLSEPAIFEQQVERMLQDDKAAALIDNFAAQWLFLRNLKSINPDTRTFPNFDDKLRQAFRSETTIFLNSIMREDKSVLDMLTADYTFVNDRLAEHYGIPNIYGSHFRRVQQVDPNRRGLLGQGSILTVTSLPNRTSPVLRGKWVLENIIGSPPPTPPPDVPSLDENTPGLAALSVRARLEKHREEPVCAGCHAVMDPLGFSFEHFDAIGRARNKDASGAIDAGGELADGTPVNGAASLQQALLRHPEYFVDTFTEKLLTYALGRGLEHYDMPVVRAITKAAAADDYRFSAIVKGIVHSTPFRMKMKAAPAVTVAATQQQANL